MTVLRWKSTASCISGSVIIHRYISTSSAERFKMKKKELKLALKPQINDHNRNQLDDDDDQNQKNLMDEGMGKVNVPQRVEA